jgi:pimeloyl-ACP methyl ester carboxylesterase
LGKISFVTLVKRPDGAEIHWESQGEGPTVLLTHHTLWSYPALYERLIADLASDHQVVVYDPRGCGQSSRAGPYDVETDAGDLAAVAEAAGGAAVAIAVGDGVNRAARVAAARPELIGALIAIVPGAAAVLPHSELEGSGVMAASDSVMDVLMQMMNTDPRAALRSVLTAINPDLDEDELRERVDRVAGYLTIEAAMARAVAFLEDDLSPHVKRLGERVWILHGGVDPLFEGALGARVAELFPRARIEGLADGPVSRPDLTAARVRSLTGVKT